LPLAVFVENIIPSSAYDSSSLETNGWPFSEMVNLCLTVNDTLEDPLLKTQDLSLLSQVAYMDPPWTEIIADATAKVKAT
jgi:hypothetical protein